MADVVLLDNLERSITYQGIQKIRLPTPGGGTEEFRIGGGGGPFAALVDRSITSVSVEDLDGVTSIGNHAFENCGSLRSASLPTGVTSIGDRAFAASGLQSIVIPSTVETIGEEAFYDTELGSVTLPSGLQYLGVAAFAFTRLQSLTIPEVQSFNADRVALFCGYLQSIDLPSTTLRLTSGPFFYCQSLTTIICRRSRPPTVDGTTFTYGGWTLPVNQVTIYVPSASVATYRAADYWRDYNIQAIPT